MVDNIDLTGNQYTEYCSGTNDPIDYYGLLAETVHKQIQTDITYARHDSCVSNQYMETDDGMEENRVYKAVGRLNTIQEDPLPVIPLEWENTAHFQLSWIDKIFQHQKDLLPAEKIKNEMDLRTWFVYY